MPPSSEESAFSHLGNKGQPRMVDVGDKPVTVRRAVATALVRLRPETLKLVGEGRLAKGDIFQVARLAGIQAAKRTSELIPLCHNLPLSAVWIDVEPAGEDAVRVRLEVRGEGRTGMEMEALTGAAIAALTVYDMVKGVDRSATIERLQLEEKEGGKSGHFRRAPGPT